MTIEYSIVIFTKYLMLLFEIFSNQNSENPNVWWYNSLTGERIHITSQEHYRDLNLRQHEFGIQINPEMGENTRKDVAFRHGWVRVRFHPTSGELDIEGRIKRDVLNAAKDALTTHPNISYAIIEIAEKWWRLEDMDFDKFISKGILPRNI